MEAEHDDKDESLNEELFISEEASTELDLIIQRVENWKSSEELEPDQSRPCDLQTLQQKLLKQGQLIHLLAETNISLLHVYLKSKDKKTEDNAQNERLKEEIMQLTFRNSSLVDQLKQLERQSADADHRVEDLMIENGRLAAAALSIDASIQEKLKELQKENNDLNSLISELVSELKSHEKHTSTEQQKMKKKMNLLQESLDSKEAEMAKTEKSEMALKKDVKELNERLLAVVVEAKELREELERNRMKSDHYKFLLEKSELENAECREMLCKTKQQLSNSNKRITRIRLIRHIQNNSDSSHVDPDCMACELDKVCGLRRRFDHSTSEYGSTSWPEESGSISCDNLSLVSLSCDAVDGNSDVYYPMKFQPPMGQPGRPGTFDLDMALDRLNWLQHWKRIFARQIRPASTNMPDVNPRIPCSLHFDCGISTLANPLTANSSFRSTISFPMQISFNNSFEGLNNIERVLHSGVLVRGCEIANVSEETNSVRDFEEDDGFNSKTDEINSINFSMNASKSIAWRDSVFVKHKSGFLSSSGMQIESDQNDFVPTSKSNNAGRSGDVTGSVLQGTVVQRTNLGKMTSKPMAQNNQEMLPDCIIS